MLELIEVWLSVAFGCFVSFALASSLRSSFSFGMASTVFLIAEFFGVAIGFSAAKRKDDLGLSSASKYWSYLSKNYVASNILCSTSSIVILTLSADFGSESFPLFFYCSFLIL